MPAAKANSKFMAPITPNDTLAAVIGPKPVPRTEIVKKLWAYIKKQVTMFDLAKIIGKNAK